MHIIFSLVQNLKGGEIIWAKYGRFPFWPAMVSCVLWEGGEVVWCPECRGIGSSLHNLFKC